MKGIYKKRYILGLWMMTVFLCLFSFLGYKYVSNLMTNNENVIKEVEDNGNKISSDNKKEASGTPVSDANALIMASGDLDVDNSTVEAFLTEDITLENMIDVSYYYDSDYESSYGYIFQIDLNGHDLYMKNGGVMYVCDYGEIQIYNTSSNSSTIYVEGNYYTPFRSDAGIFRFENINIVSNSTDATIFHCIDYETELEDGSNSSVDIYIKNCNISCPQTSVFEFDCSYNSDTMSVNLYDNTFTALSIADLGPTLYFYLGNNSYNTTNYDFAISSSSIQLNFSDEFLSSTQKLKLKVSSTGTYNFAYSKASHTEIIEKIEIVSPAYGCEVYSYNSTYLGIRSSSTINFKFTLSTPTSVSKVYNGSASTLTSTVTCNFDGATFIYKWYKGTTLLSTSASTTNKSSTYNVTNVSDSGTYYCEVLGTFTYNGTNYTSTVKSTGYSVSITGASFSASVSMAGYAYGGTKSTPSVSSNPGGGSVTYYYNTSNSNSGGTAWTSVASSTSLNAGTYYMYAVIGSSGNYSSVTTGTTSFTISKGSISPKVSMTSYNYGGTKSTPSVTGNTGNGSVTYYYTTSNTNSGGTLWSNVTNSSSLSPGTYYMYAVIGASTNYNGATTPQVSFSVVQNSFSATVSMAGYTYGGTKSTPSISANPGGGSVTYYYNTSNSNNGGTAWTNVASSTSLNAGTYYMYAVIAASGSYAQTKTGTTAFTISKAGISPSVNMAGYTYGGTKSTPSVTGNSGNGSITYYYSTSNSNSGGTAWTNVASSTSLNAGTYYMYAVIGASTNYNGATTAAKAFTISKASISPSVNMSGYTYGGTKSTPSVTGNSGNGSVTYYYSTSNSNSGGTAWTNVTSSTSLNAGTYYMYAVIGASTNYNGATTGATAFTISKAGISPSVNMAGYTYGGTKSTPSVTGNSGNGSVTYYYSKSASNSGGTAWTNVANSTSLPVGTYYMYAVIGSTTNYNGATTGAVSFVISAASYQSTVNMSGYTYGGVKSTPSITSNPGNGTVTYYYSSSNQNSGGSLWSNVTSSTSLNAGTYYMYATIGASGNYATYTTATKQFVISPAEITIVDAANASKVYDGTALVKYVTAKSSVTGASASVDYHGTTPSLINCGSITVNYTVSLANHNSKSGSYTITVTQKPITITIVPNSIATQEYTGKVTYLNRGVSIKSSNDISSSEYSKISLDISNAVFTFDNSQTLNQNVGLHTIAVSSVKATSDNYSVSILYDTTQYEITAASLVVVDQDVTVTYDSYGHGPNISVVTVNNQPYNIYYSELSNSDAKNKTNQTAPSYVNVKRVNNIVSGYVVYYYIEATNHNTCEGSVVITINPKDLAVTITPETKTYVYSGQVVYDGSYQISAVGLANNDIGKESQVLSFTGTPVYRFDGTALNQNANESGYVITMTNVTCNASNYNVTYGFGEGRLFITKKDISLANVSIADSDITYDGTKHTPTPTVYINLVTGQADVLLTSPLSYTYEYYDNQNASTTALIAISGCGNYKGTKNFYFTIKQAELGNLVADLSLKTLNVLTEIENSVRLTSLSDVDLTSNQNGYGSWKFANKYNISSPIYSAGSKVYTYQFDMVFDSSNSNYKDSTGVLTVNLNKNDVIFESLPVVNVVYSRQEIVDPNFAIKNYNSTYNSTPVVRYYKNNNLLTYKPIEVDSYLYEVYCEANEYYNEATSSKIDALITQMDVSQLSYPQISSQTYTGFEIKPEISILHESIEIDSSDVQLIYSNNISATRVSQSYAKITVVGLKNYNGTYDLFFEITPKDISNCFIGDIADQQYDETAKTPDIVVSDPDRNVVLTITNDYTKVYENNTNVGNGVVNVSGVGNYFGTISKEFKILGGSISTTLVPDVSTLYANVDNTFGMINQQLAQFNTQDGTFSFYNDQTNADYLTTDIVATSVPTTGVATFKVKFQPTNQNFNPVYKNVNVVISLNDSIVEFVDNDGLSHIYDATSFELTKNDIIKMDISRNLYETEFDNDSISFTYYKSDGVTVIAPPSSVGDYKVKVDVAANRKYKASTATIDLEITPRSINDTSYLFINPDQVDDKYEFTTQEIKPLLDIKYNDYLLNSKFDDYEILGYENNINVSLTSKASITIKGINNFTGTRVINFEIIKKNVNNLDIIEIADQYYSGSYITPDVVIFNTITQLSEGIDFNATYSFNLSVGTAQILVVGTGNYEGETIVYFEIIKKKFDENLLPQLEGLIKYVNTRLDEITLPSNQYGIWEFEDLKSNPDATVGLANPSGTRFRVSFNAGDEYSCVYDNVFIVVIKHNSTLEITNSLDKVYDTLPANAPELNSTGDGQVTIKYFQNNNEIVSPTNAGSYRVLVTMDETDTYLPATAEAYFTISQAIIGSANVVISSVSAQNYDNGVQIIPEITIIHTYDGVNEYTLVEGIDYAVVAGANNTTGNQAGKLYVFGINNYKTASSFEEITFAILAQGGITYKPDESSEPVEIEIIVKDIQDYVFTGNEITPLVEVLHDDTLLEINEDYLLRYEDNINKGQGSVIIMFINKYDGDYTKKFNILPYELDATNVTITETTVGTKPTITVVALENTLILGSDYNVAYGNDAIGVQTAIVAGINNYTGIVSIEYLVTRVQPNVLEIIEENENYKFYTYNASSRRNKWSVLNHTSYDQTKEVYLKNVSQDEKIEKFLTQFVNSSKYINVYDANGNKVTSLTKYVTNGTVLELVDDYGNVKDRVTVIIIGDVNCDGRVNASDRILVINYFSYKVDGLSTVAKFALDATGEGSLNNTDLSLIEKHFSKTKILNQDYKLD